MSWYVYIIETKCGKLYTGITTDLQRRFTEHLQGKKGARFFRISSPKIILFQEQHADRSQASKREYEIKKMSRKQKFELINNNLHVLANMVKN